MKQWKKFRYKGLLAILAVYLFIAVILFAERSGIRYQENAKKEFWMPEELVVTSKEAEKSLKTTCLVLTDSRKEASMQAKKQFQQIFRDMKVGYRIVDVAEEEIPDFEEFETAVVLLSDLSPMEEDVLRLTDWVKEGGDALFALTLEKERYLSLIEQKLGIISSGYENAQVNSIFPSEGFMLGGGMGYEITDPFDSAWSVELGENAVVHAWTDDEKKIPLVWETPYGEGKFVVDNFGLYEKATRGFFAASYSLLTEVSAYPVINGSVFYLDDFPSPVPSGDGTYVKRDYGTNIADFYSSIWWPDTLKLAEKYGVIYTGVIIEDYNDRTDGVIERNKDTERFQYFGSMLIRSGGEIGYHGYNHQPLSLGNVDYGNALPYHVWKDYDAMKAAVQELVDFGDDMFPGTEKSVYVPPSNVLSAEGRQMLAKEFPHIRTVAGIYFIDDFAYEQEFEVADDGVVEQPRIISGGIIDEYMQMAALSELNMHFVNNHFMHPDDLLDKDRGAELGWEKLKNRLDEYMKWLYTSAPPIRNLTGSELSGAIQRYASVTVEKEMTENQVLFHLGNFYDEAYLMVRINEGQPGNVTGGSLEHLTGNLYLLCANENEVAIELN